MKSTKIEDILADEIEEASETNINEIKQDDVQDELRDQLENLKSELSMMKKDTTSSTEHEQAEMKPTIKNTEQKVERSNSAEQEVGLLEKLLKFNKSDVKQIIILSLMFVITNSVYINEMIDNMIPYSLYSYTFVIKLVLFIVTFRILNLVEI